MTDHEESNHWNLIASELGFTTPPKEEKKPPVSEEAPAGESEVTAKKAPSGPTATRAPRAPQPRRTAQDWRRLAGQLGVVCDEEVAGPPPPEAKPLPAFETPPGPATGEQAAIEPVTLQPVEDLAEPADVHADVPVAGDEPADTVSTSADKKPGRRRRKRGRRPRGLSEGDPAETGSEAGEEESDEELAEAEDRQEASSAEATDSSATAGEKAQARPSRPRRRRSSGRKRGLAEREVEAAPPEIDGEPSVPQAESASSQDNDRKSGTPGPGDTEKGAGDPKKERAGQDSKSGKVRHHGIPNWEEAIGIVISANMEARAKSPNGGSSSRSRGGRARGRRDKSSEKPN